MAVAESKTPRLATGAATALDAEAARLTKLWSVRARPTCCSNKGEHSRRHNCDLTQPTKSARRTRVPVPTARPEPIARGARISLARVALARCCSPTAHRVCACISDARACCLPSQPLLRCWPRRLTPPPPPPLPPPPRHRPCRRRRPCSEPWRPRAAPARSCAPAGTSRSTS
jgi:hypothetical protein